MSDWSDMSIHMLQQAFPDRPTEEEYRVLLCILAPLMSRRNLTDLMIVYTGRADYKVANDVLGVHGAPPANEEVQRVQHLLDGAGFDIWLRDA